MDYHERSMARARAEWSAKRAAKTSSSLWGFENWANEGTEGHHVARKKYGDQLIDVPISMHRELTRRQMEEHPPDGPDPENPSGLTNVSAAISIGNFECVANAPAQEIAPARDDAKNSLAIALNLYEANRWIYGDGAFGLRLAAWIARKAPDVLFDAMTLLMFRLRQVPDAIRPSDEIAEMAEQARQVCLYSKTHEWYWRNDPRFSKILDPKRMKLAFADEIALKRWQSQLNAINLQATAKAPNGFH